MPLEVRHLGAGKENILSSLSLGPLLVDLNLHDVRRVLDDLGNISPVARPDLTQDTLGDPDDTANQPITLKGNERVIDHEQGARV